MHKGKLYFVYGTMGSAKTAMLLTKAYNFEERGIYFLCMKPSIDTRDGDNIIHSRIGIERSCLTIKPKDNIYEIIEGRVFPDWILVDEAQFLSKEQIDQLAKIVDNFGTNIICYGLRTDFQTKLFPGSKRLFEIADSIEEIKSTCSCGNKSIVNARLSQSGEIIKEGEQVEIGGNDKYISMCRHCWNHS